MLYRLLRFNRRKAARYRVDGLALLLAGNNVREHAQVDDLSLEGISFTYHDSGTPLDTVIEVDLKAGPDFHLGWVKVKTVEDVLVAENLTDMTRLRRFSGRFINITVQQSYDLRGFLKKRGMA